MKKTIKAILMAIILFASLQAEATKIKVISREAINGGFFGYDYVHAEMTTYTTEHEGKTYTHLGYEVTCAKPGFTLCPKLGAEYRPAQPTDNWDNTQILKADELMTYALQKIAQGDVSGTHAITVHVAGESVKRVYEVVWNSNAGKIEITREDFKI